MKCAKVCGFPFLYCAFRMLIGWACKLRPVPLLFFIKIIHAAQELQLFSESPPDEEIIHGLIICVSFYEVSLLTGGLNNSLVGNTYKERKGKKTERKLLDLWPNGLAS